MLYVALPFFFLLKKFLIFRCCLLKPSLKAVTFPPSLPLFPGLRLPWFYLAAHPFHSSQCRFLLRGQSPLHPQRPQLRHLKGSPETFILLAEVVYRLRFEAAFTLQAQAGDQLSTRAGCTLGFQGGCGHLRRSQVNLEVWN